jgi:putative transposase
MPLLQRPDVAVIVEQTIFKYRDAGHYLVHSYVVMPNHIHVILTPGYSTTLEKCVQLVKGGSSHEVGQQTGKKLPLWQPGFTEHQIRDRNDFEKHVKYIDSNPASAGLPKDYEWSSASGRHELDAWPPAPAAKAATEVAAGLADLKVRPFDRSL